MLVRALDNGDDGPHLYLGELVLLSGQLTRHHGLAVAHGAGDQRQSAGRLGARQGVLPLHRGEVPPALPSTPE